MCNFATVFVLLYFTLLSQLGQFLGICAKTNHCLKNGKVIKENLLIKIDVASEYKK